MVDRCDGGYLQWRMIAMVVTAMLDGFNGR